MYLSVSIVQSVKFLILALLAIIPLRAEDWTVDGKDYHNIKVGTVDPDKVHISYDGGIGSVPLADLTPDLQKRFGYNPSKAKEAASADEQARLKAVADSKAISAKYASAPPTSSVPTSAASAPWVVPLKNVKVYSSPMAQRAESQEQFYMNQQAYQQDAQH
jgi:hypothetical protein